METKTYTVEQLTKAGGKLWEQGGMRRMYFNSLASRIGLALDHYNTGNISSAKLAGEGISNCAARKIISALQDMKIWYDLTDGQFHYKYYSRPDLAEQIIVQIRAELEA